MPEPWIIEHPDVSPEVDYVGLRSHFLDHHPEVMFTSADLRSMSRNDLWNLHERNHHAR